ncbi:unnamed protein product [Rotaria sp. Silwood2]|nr:unnamed protein product [Rotaria sp. Silwood2]
MQMLPLNAIGELFLNGDCLSRGYLNRPELTAERFLSNPFQTDEEKKGGKNGRIYKTGDLVRWLPDGELEYLGRNDLQVKIRGLRIELGEIEAVLSSHPGVNHSVVVAKEYKKKNVDTSSAKYLVGYYVSDNCIGESDLKQYMQTRLPDYMIPNRLIPIEKIPVTVTGKLNAKALPDIDFSVDENDYCAPRNELEVKLCEIWSHLLGIEKISITDDFFRLGGDSIGSLQITIEKLYDNKLKHQLIQSNDISQSSKRIELENSSEEDASTFLLPVQEYLLKEKVFSHNHFNQYVLFQIARFDETRFKDCLVKLVAHNEAFRIRFKRNSEGKYSQYYQPSLDLEEINLVQIKPSPANEMNFETKLNELLRKKVDIENGPIYMVAYSYDHEDCSSAIVWIFMHDFIFDWTSCHLISEDLQRFYTDSNFISSSGYKQWSSAVKSYVNNIGTNEMAYWQNLMNSNMTIINETLGNKQLTTNDISETEIILAEEITRDFLINCNKIYNTEIEHLLLTALSYTLRDEITSLNENYAMFECCARNLLNNSDIDRSIGMFRTIYPVRLQLDDDDLRNSIINIKEHMKQVPNKGIGFGSIICNEDNDFPRVLFNYLGQFESEENGNGYEDKWCLLHSFCKNTMDENTTVLIKINSFIMNKQIGLNIKAKMGIERIIRFGKVFQFNFEKIIKHTQLANRCYLTRSDINYVIKNDDYLNRIQLEKEVDAIFMVNSLQQGLLYHSLKQSNVDDAYIVQSVFQYRTNINQELFKMAWEQAQKRFSSLRLRFAWQEELVQIIDKEQVLDWRFIDLTTEENISNQESKIEQIQEQDRNERFILDIGNLLRVYLIQQKSNLFVVIFSFHHIILDGWSLPILFDYVHEEYLTLMEGKRQILTASCRSSLRDETYEKAQFYLQNHRLDNTEYWENEINKIEERCDLNGLLKEEYKNKVILNEYDHVKQPKARTLLIKDNLYRNLRNICRKNGFTLSSILQFVWHKILNVYGNSNQTIIGTIVSGRNLPIDDIETSVGLFINTLPLIVNHHSDGSIIHAIENIQDTMNEMIGRSNVTFSELSKGKIKHTLFDCLFVYENYPTLQNNKVQKQKVLKFEKNYFVDKIDYPLAIVAYETVENESVTFILKYASELFDETIIDNILAVVYELLTQIGDNQVKQISDLHFLPKQQLNMINEWNNTYRDFPKSSKQITLHKLFEEEVEKSVDKIAVIYKGVQLTYGELNKKANQLAHYLRSICDIYSDDLIALILDKSELMIISILGVWKSGAAYVPIDPSYPDERIQFILQDTKTKIVITNEKYMTRLHSYDLIKIPIDCALVNQLIKTNSMNFNPDLNTNEHNLAYVIYTSGTTGKPKGVLIEHQSVASLSNDLKYRYFGNNDTDSWPQAILFFSNYVFDFSIEQLALSILSSNILIILANTFIIDDKFYSYLNEHRLIYLSGTPTQLQQINLKELKYLQTLTMSGEPLHETLFQKIRTEYTGKIINAYGITETTVYNMVYVYENAMKYKNSIGSLLSNTKRFVLNNKMQMLPVHAIGELYLTGDCISRGYLNRPELTAERFLPNPFQTNQEQKEGKNARIYKTGDLVRWLPDGELEYLGRNDFQVKIRGLRIELGEIQAVLSSYQGVKQSVVIARDAKTVDAEGRWRKYLLGYFVAENALAECDIKQYMGTKLPDYMIPNRLIHIEKIPVNISGKLDSCALPEVDFAKNDENELVRPRNDLEAKIVQIWSDLLGIPAENISIHDDFFSLGGDSILVIKLSLMLTKLLAVKLGVAAMFKNETIAKLASHILHGVDYASGHNDHMLTMSADYSTHSNYILSFAQERLFFINEFNDDNCKHAYNIPIYTKFWNINVRRDLLRQSLLAILYRHEILRTLLYEDKSSVVYQHPLNEADADSLFQVNEVYVDNNEQLDAELIQLAKYVFNLRKELPIKVTFYEMKNEDGSDFTTLYMGILMHHICFDGWSGNIFWKELQIFYDYFEKQINNSSSDTSSSLTLNLPPLPVQYKDFADWQKKYLSGNRLYSLSEFWKNKLDGFETLNLIPDCPIRPAKYDYTGDEIMFELKEQTTTELKQLAKNLNVSLFSLLLSAYTFMLSNYTNQQDIVLGTPVANRNHPELENLIGFFVNMLVLRIKLDTHDSAIDYIRKVSNEVINAQIHQDMPFERLVKELQVEHDASRHPIVQVIFVLNNQFELTESATSIGVNSTKSIRMSKYLPNLTYFKTAKFDITTSIDETDTSLKGTFNFATKIFNRITIHNLTESFIHVLTQFSKLTETRKILDIDCINAEQHNQIENWNNVHTDFTQFNQQTTLHKLFEEEVEKSVDKIAVVYEDVKLTYRELNKKANQLAHYLRSICNIHPDDLIALLLDKSELMIVSILGVWKSGAAYVPIDPSYPDERIQFILQDTKAKIIIGSKKYIKRLQSYDIIKIEIDTAEANELLNTSGMNFNVEAITEGKNLAYVIYTSGTTGNPKGVLIEHQSVVSYRNNGFVLNQNMQMLPINAIGELYLTGDCLSKGYLNRPELTAERFLPNPFQTDEEKKGGKNGRIYKTGDLVRWLPDGELEYLGRNDFQLVDNDVRHSIINVKEHLRQVPNKGIGFGAIISNNEKNDLPRVSFNYLGLFENENNGNVNEDEWRLLGAFCKNRMDESTKELIEINSFIINKQMRLDIKAKMEIEGTVQFGKVFQFNIEKIIKHTQLIEFN